MECTHAHTLHACVQSVRMRDFTVPSDERPGNKDDSTVPAFAISGRTSTLPTCQYSIDIFHIKTSKYSRLESRSWKSRTMLTQTPRVADIWQRAKWRPSLKADLFRKNDFTHRKYYIASRTAGDWSCFGRRDVLDYQRSRKYCCANRYSVFIEL